MVVITEEKMVECINKMRSTVHHVNRGSDDVTPSKHMGNLCDIAINFHVCYAFRPSSPSWSLQFGRLVLVSQKFPYGDILMKIKNGEDNMKTIGTLRHDLSQSSNSIVSLMFYMNEYSVDANRIAEVGHGFLLLLQAFDFIDRLNLPEYAWVPEIEPSAMKWLRRYEISDPSFEPTREGLELLNQGHRQVIDDSAV